MNSGAMLYNIPQLMGIVNVTEDSFSDGSMYLDPKQAIKHAEELIAQGATIIDLGAESTRPGALPISAELQLERLLPVIIGIKSLYPELVISVDTRSALVARETIAVGASIINDISALRHDPEMAIVMATHPQVQLILMHMQGEPETMQMAPYYNDLIGEIKAFFTERIAFCQAQGIDRNSIMLDPGIGFGKNLQHNLELLVRLDEFASFGLPLVLGASRKSFINMLSTSAPQQRLPGTLAVAAWGMMKGAAILRVHDVAEHQQFIKVFHAIAIATGDDR